MKTESVSELVDITGNNNATQEDVAKQPTLRMKTESRREIIDRLNEMSKEALTPLDNQVNWLADSRFLLHARKILALANHQEEIIQGMKAKCVEIAANDYAQSPRNILRAKEAIALADAPYGGGE